MFLFIGVLPRERVLANVSFVCAVCGNAAMQRVLEVGSRLWVFFIPLVTFGRRYVVVCSHCGGVTELTRDEAMDVDAWVARNRVGG